MGAAGKEKEYYVLKPLYQKGATVYIPLDNPTLTEKIRPAVKREEIDSIILEAKKQPLEWINDDHKRGEVFREIIHSGDLLSLIRLVSCIYLQGEQLNQTKHRLRVVDALAFSNAETFLYNEFAFGLGRKPEQVIEYIKAKMEE